MRALIDFLDLIKPGWQFIQILVMSGLVLYAVYSLVRRFDALLALFFCPSGGITRSAAAPEHAHL
jgi:hypothetical protein